MTGSADPRHRPVLLDTGEITLPPSPRGLARRALDLAVVALLGAGAIAAGGWSILTAAQGPEPTENSAPLWYPPPLSSPTPTAPR